ncbi:unnamed protein product [Rhizopus stolonifer]
MSFYNNLPTNEASSSDSKEEVYYTAPNSPVSSTDEIGMRDLSISSRSLSGMLGLYLSASTQSEQKRAGMESVSPFPRVRKVGFPSGIIRRSRRREICLYFLNSRIPRNMDYEDYIKDYREVDGLVIKDDNEKNISYTKAWHHMKRLVFFQTAGVGRGRACVECRVQLNRENITSVVNKRRRGPLCKWCKRLFARFGSLDQEIEVLHYLLYGELAPHEMAVADLFDQKALPLNERGRMIKQLVKRDHNSNWRCALTNAPIFYTKGGGEPRYWRASIDHIIPLSEARYTSVSVTSIRNIQIVSHIMNMIKQSFPNESLIEWWGRFRENQMKP